MANADYAAITERAVKMAKLDREINGFYLNAPYKVIGVDGVTYKGRLHTIPDEPDAVQLVVERPVQIIGQERLTNRDMSKK